MAMLGRIRGSFTFGLIQETLVESKLWKVRPFLRRPHNSKSAGYDFLEVREALFRSVRNDSTSSR